jgi:hypothetical protein
MDKTRDTYYNGGEGAAWRKICENSPNKKKLV